MIVRPLLLLAVTALAACDRRGPDPATVRERTSKALTGVLAYPDSRLASMAAGSEAAGLTLTSAAEPERVVAWYRETLRLNGWESKSDAAQPDGSVVIHAMKEGRPLWITIRRSSGAPGSTYALIGVVLEGDSIR